MTTLAPRLAGLRVVVCAGAGGVGKTTVSAALALGLARRGASVAVVTIDPARRLAEALGLEALGNDPQVVDAARLGGGMRGTLWAMMLDVERTFDELVAHLAPDAATRDALLANPVYRHLSGAVAGSQEYGAMAKLFQIAGDGRFDVVVLDTPPSRNALDFLDAPARLTGFLDSRAFWLFASSGAGAARAASLAFGALRRVTGVGLVEDLAAFFALLHEIAGGFRRRAVDVEALLRAPTTGFVVVASPERAAVEEAVFLAGRLDASGMRRAGLVVNRVHPLEPGGADEAATAARLTPALGAPLAARVAHAHVEVQRLAHRDAAAVDHLRGALGDVAPVRLADREGDVSDVAALTGLARELLGG